MALESGQSGEIQNGRRSRLNGDSLNEVRRRLSFSECVRKRSSSPKRAYRGKGKNTDQEKMDDSGFISTPGSSRESHGHLSFSTYRWRQLSPELTSSDSDDSLVDVPMELPQKRRNVPAKGRSGSKKNKAENAIPRKPQRVVNKRKKSADGCESPIAKKQQRKGTPRRSQRARSVPATPATSEESKENFELNIVNEDPLDGRSWGETPEERRQKAQRVLMDARNHENHGFLQMAGIEYELSEEDALNVEMDGLQL